MALDLYTVKEDFASMVQRVQPWTLSQFVMWLDLKVAEYKVHGYMILDFEDRLSQFFNTDLRREMAASQQLKKQPSPKITPKRTAPSMQLSSRQSTSATSTANLECSQEPLNNLGSSINQGRTHDWLMPQHTVSQVSHGSEVAQKETSVPSRLCPTIVRPREINQVENDPVPRDSQMDLVMDVETEADNAGIDINWTNSATEPISGSSVYHKNSLVYHEESPSFKNPSTYSKETNDYRKETSEYSKETSSSSKSMRTNQSQQNSEESSHGKTNTEHCGLSLPVTEIKIEDFKNDEEENANENFTVTVENSSSSNSLVETNDYMRIEENSDSDTKEEKQETLQQDQPVMWQTGESSREPCCPCLNRGKCGSCCCKDTGCTSCVNSMCKFMGAQMKVNVQNSTPVGSGYGTEEIRGLFSERTDNVTLSNLSKDTSFTCGKGQMVNTTMAVQGNPQLANYNHRCECGQLFFTLGTLEVHRKVEHSGTAAHEFRCSLCMLQLTTFQEMQDHIKYQHADAAQVCKNCGALFVSIDLLTEHVKKYHWEFTCKHCGKKFGRKHHLESHMRLHEENPTLFACSKCDYTSVYKHSVQRHLNSVHNHERKHLCIKCGKKFKLVSSLVRHRLRCGNSPEQTHDVFY